MSLEYARSIQLRCFREVSTNPYGIPVPAGTAEAISWLEDALAAHWTGSHYATIQALEQYMPADKINLDFGDGMLFKRLDNLID